jgi:hypothetical protein
MNQPQLKATKRRTRRRLGRAATGPDPIIQMRLPEKLLADIDDWAAAYRHEHGLVMNRSIAIRCLFLLGLNSLQYRAVDPKTQLTYEGATAPLF